jgi:hypothetical protein
LIVYVLPVNYVKGIRRRSKKYGLYLLKLAASYFWIMVCVDLVGPFTIRTPSKTQSLLVLIMIDPAINTGWFEIVDQATLTLEYIV